MSKCHLETVSYLSEDPADIKKKVMSMYTDPNHIRVEDPGQIEGNSVFTYLDAFSKPEYFEEFLPDYSGMDELKEHYTRGGLGDVKVKKFLNNVLQAELAPIRERRQMWEKRPQDVYDILKSGSEVARAKAAETLGRCAPCDEDRLLRERQSVQVRNNITFS